MEIGLLEWYKDENGYGVLTTPDKKEVFLHKSNWQDTIELTSSIFYPILFDIGFQRNKTTALNAVQFNTEKETHWEKLFSLYNYSFSVFVKNKSKNLLETILSKHNNEFNFKRFRKHLSNSIDNISDDELFNKDTFYCNFYAKTENEEFKNVLLELIFIRYNQLASLNMFTVWKENIFPELKPTHESLIACYKDISIADIKRIDNSEQISLILLKKLDRLKNEFDLIEFHNFQDYIEFVKFEKLQNKIINDLNSIANSYYFKILQEELNDLISSEKTSYTDIDNFISTIPKFLGEDFNSKFDDLLQDRIVKKCSFRTITNCWKENLLSHLDESIITSFELQSNNDLHYFLGCDKITQNHSESICNVLLKRQEFELLLDETKRSHFDLFDKYDRLIYSQIDEQQYFDFWICRKGKLTPFNYLIKYLNHEETNYLRFERWINQEIISSEDATNVLLEKIENTKSINSRNDFYNVFFSTKLLININDDFQSLFKPNENDFVSLLLWHFKKSDKFNFETLKGKFIYFNPDDQVYIFKRLFYLKYKGKLDFDIYKLDEILRADLDLHLANEKFDTDFVLDISTHVIIECLKSFAQTKSFVFESDYILKDLKRHSKRKFKIEKYFDHCEGRQTATWDWDTNGKVERVKTLINGKFFDYYKVQFEFDADIVADIKKLPKRKYYPKEESWGVSKSCESELFELARKHKLFINLPDGKHYENNLHLIFYSRKTKIGKGPWEANVPRGITFCEGRKAKKEYSKYKKEFWWCGNQECFQNCVSEHYSKEIKEAEKDYWEHYTLFDFLKILNFDIDEHNGLDIIEDGHYYKFLGHINAFNRLLEHLYCEECGNLLYPTKSAHFALYRDVRFHCIEDGCSKKNNEIYLNHCLNGECRPTIIDSRISKQCKNGLYICSECGTCCSNEFFERRIKNLKEVGGYIHPELIINVKEKNGHLEKKEYYCYKCAGMMTEINETTYRCLECDVTYDLEKYKWLYKKWTQKHNRRPDYPTLTVSS